jgi:hypothetical protein
MTIQEVLETTKLPTYYFTPKGKKLPARYLVWYGNGQTAADADDTLYFRKNGYVVEYYFKRKDEEAEEVIELALLDNGYLFEKSEDVYIDDEGVFAIYYYVS